MIIFTGKRKMHSNYPPYSYTLLLSLLFFSSTQAQKEEWEEESLIEADDEKRKLTDSKIVKDTIEELEKKHDNFIRLIELGIVLILLAMAYFSTHIDKPTQQVALQSPPRIAQHQEEDPWWAQELDQKEMDPHSIASEAEYKSNPKLISCLVSGVGGYAYAKENELYISWFNSLTRKRGEHNYPITHLAGIPGRSFEVISIDSSNLLSLWTLKINPRKEARYNLQLAHPCQEILALTKERIVLCINKGEQYELALYSLSKKHALQMLNTITININPSLFSVSDNGQNIAIYDQSTSTIHTWHTQDDEITILQKGYDITGPDLHDISTLSYHIGSTILFGTKKGAIYLHERSDQENTITPISDETTQHQSAIKKIGTDHVEQVFYSISNDGVIKKWEYNGTSCISFKTVAENISGVDLHTFFDYDTDRERCNQYIIFIYIITPVAIFKIDGLSEEEMQVSQIEAVHGNEISQLYSFHVTEKPREIISVIANQMGLLLIRTEFNYRTYTTISQQDIHSTVLKFMPHHDTLITGTTTGELIIYDLQGEEVQRLKHGDKPIQTIQTIEEFNKLLTADEETLKVWTLTEQMREGVQEEKDRVIEDEASESLIPIPEVDGSSQISCITTSKKGKQVALVIKNQLFLGKIAKSSGEVPITFTKCNLSNPGTIKSLSYSQSGRQLAIAVGTHIEIIDPHNTTTIRSYSTNCSLIRYTHEETTPHLVTLPVRDDEEGRYHIDIWDDYKRDRTKHSLIAGATPITTLSITTDNQTIIASDEAGIIYEWTSSAT